MYNSTHKRKFIKQTIVKYGFYAALLASGIQGTNTVAYKLAFDTMDPILFTALRNIVIGAVFLLFVKGFRHLMRPKQFIHLLLHTLLGLFVLVTLAIGIDLSTAINASIMSLVLPIFIYVFAILFLREPVLRQVLAGVFIALTGSAIIIGLPLILEQRIILGDIVLFSSYIGLAAMIVHTKYAYKYLSTFDLLAIRFFVSGLVLAVYLFVFTDVSLAGISAVSWWSLVYSSIITGLLATGLYYYALRHIKAEYTAPIFYIDPFVGVITAALVLQEALTLSAAIGGAVIALGIVISHVPVSRVLHRVHLPARYQNMRRYVSSHLRR